MAWTEWIKTDDYQWQRKDGGTYEMYEAVFHPGVDKWFVGGGKFRMDEFTDGDVAYVLDTYGYDTMENLEEEFGDCSEMVLAECLFETSFADWDLECFDTEAEAVAYLDELMKEE